MRLKPSNPARPARPATMDETTSGTMIIFKAWRKRSPRREQIFKKEWIHGASSKFFRIVPKITAKINAMIICQCAGIFFMSVCYRYEGWCKKLNFTLHFL